MNIWEEMIWFMYLDKPEVENLGNEPWDENTPTIGDREPELSEVRVIGSTNGKAQPAKTAQN